MKTPRNILVAAVLAAGMVLPAAVVAQPAADNGWYIGGFIGQSTAKDACNDLTGIPGVSCDDTDTAWKILGGYQINRNFAAEIGYANLGEVSASGFGVTASVESKAWELVGLAGWPITNQFSVFGKLGFYRADTDATSNVGINASETNNDLTYGFGVKYDFSRNLGLRAEWQRYSDVGGGDVGKSDVDVMGLTLLWKF